MYCLLGFGPGAPILHWMTQHAIKRTKTEHAYMFEYMYINVLQKNVYIYIVTYVKIHVYVTLYTYVTDKL